MAYRCKQFYCATRGMEDPEGDQSGLLLFCVCVNWNVNEHQDSVEMRGEKSRKMERERICE